MTREFAHPSSITTQPEEKLKAQPIIAAKLLLRCKNWRRSRERIRAAAYRRGLLDSDRRPAGSAICSILLRYSAAKPSPPQSKNLTPPKSLRADYVANILLPAAIA